MARGKVISFSMERALGELELDDGGRFSFTLDHLTTPGIPEAGAVADVEIGETRRGPGVLFVSIVPRAEERTETAIFLDAARGRSLVWRAGTDAVTDHPGALPLTPGDVVTMTLRRDTGVIHHGTHPPEVPASLVVSEGTISPAAADRLETRFTGAWERYRAQAATTWNDPRLAWEVRGLGRALEVAGRALPEVGALRRLLRPIDRTVLESRLGLPLGPTARALFEDARSRRPEEPALGLHDLGLNLWILHDATDTTANDVFGNVPVPSVPFASGPGEIEFASVDMGDGTGLDASPVLACHPTGRERVVADDLASFVAQVTRGEWARKRAWSSVKPTGARSRALAEARAALAPR